MSANFSIGVLPAAGPSMRRGERQRKIGCDDKARSSKVTSRGCNRRSARRGSLATLLAPWPEAADGPKYLSGRSLARSSSVGWFIVFGLFVRECFALASRRRSAYSRSRRPMNFAKAIPPKMNMHSATKIAMLFVDVGRFSGTCISTSCAALNSVL